MVEPCQIHTMTYAERTLPSLRSQSTSHQRQALTFDVIRSPTVCHKTLDLDALITYNTHTFAFGMDGLCTLSCMSPRVV
jgi:hypothetical protein